MEYDVIVGQTIEFEQVEGYWRLSKTSYLISRPLSQKWRDMAQY